MQRSLFVEPVCGVVDCDSKIFLMFRRFVIKDQITTIEWNEPVVCVADGTLLNITEACQTKVTVLGLPLQGICGVLDLDFDAL